MPKRRATSNLVLAHIDAQSPVAVAHRDDIGMDLRAVLPADWGVKLSQAAPGTLSPDALKCVQAAVDVFAVARWFELQKMPYRGTWVGAGQPEPGFLDEIEALGSTLARLNRTSSSVTSLVIDELCEIREPYMDPAEVRATLADLYDRARLLWKEHATKAGLQSEKQNDDFNQLVGTLAGVFRNAGWKVSAAKSSRAKNPRPSEFVLFVHTLMSCLPREIQQHAHSIAAMAKAVSPVIRAHRELAIAGPEEVS
ncbi:MAG TPA: hypothetical protein VGU45_01210 [Microvirga sp.]|jgi:hypothetical protein|nr:hypothetical protein [Microvirga sp.]